VCCRRNHPSSSQVDSLLIYLLTPFGIGDTDSL
jgi:hypothetical protein